MKIVLFVDGKDGVVHTLPGEQPLAEIGELLGAEEAEPRRKRMRYGFWVYYREESAPEEADYVVNCGGEDLYIAGSCIVAKMGWDGMTVLDAKPFDVKTANVLVKPTAGVRA